MPFTLSTENKHNYLEPHLQIIEETLNIKENTIKGKKTQILKMNAKEDKEEHYDIEQISSMI
jgi:hypothetical protein